MPKNVVIGIFIVLAVISGAVVYKTVLSPKPAKPVVEEQPQETLPQVDASVQVDVAKSKTKDNTVVLSVSGLASRYTLIRYELSYDSQGITQGVTSKPLDVGGKDSFVRDDIYLGTCSRNVCRPHLGVKKVSVVLEFTDTSGKKSQFSKDYTF